MPRDLMHRGLRPPGPRASWEFDEVYLCRELDDEERDAEKGGERDDDSEPEGRRDDPYDSSELPPFVNPNA